MSIKPSERSLCLGVAAGVAILVAAIFFQAIGFDFLNFDDNLYVTENPHINSGLKWSNVVWAFTSAHGGHWHPLAWVSHMVDCELFGLNPSYHHAGNILLASINAALVFTFFFRATSQLLPSLLVAILFGIHPLRIESVVWVSERKDVLSMFFSLLSLLAYQSFTKTRSAFPYVISLIFFIFALLSKPSAVVLPALFLLIDIWPLRRIEIGAKLSSWLKLIPEKIPFALGALACALAAIWAQSEAGALKSLSSYALEYRIPSVLVGYMTYLGKSFLPTGMGIFYPFAQYQPGVGAGALLGILAVSLWCWRNRSDSPMLLVGWLWFIISLLPVIGLVQVGGQAFADRWSYLPQIGLFGAIVFWLVDSPLFKGSSARTLSLFIPICISYGLTTLYNLPYWKNSETLFAHTSEISPDNFMAEMNLGVALDSAGKLDEALVHYDHAVILRPFYPDALNNLGSIRARRGEVNAAEELFRRAVTSSPNFTLGRTNLGIVLNQEGLALDAALEWAYAVMSDPNGSQARIMLNGIFARLQSQGCTDIVRTRNPGQAFSRLGAILREWPQPRDEPIRLGLIALAGCQNTVSTQNQ